MEKNGVARIRLVAIYLCFGTFWLMQCGASRTIVGNHFATSNTKLPRKTNFLNKKLDSYMLFDSLDSSSNGPYVSPPFSMAPYDSLPPTSLPENAPPYCVYPPPTQQRPSTNPTPMDNSPSPPEPMLPGPTLIPPSTPSSPTDVPTPTQPVINPPSSPGSNPPTYVPTPTQPAISPPSSNPPTTVPTPTQPPPVIGPPISEPSPPHNIPSVPSPRFLPPVVYPPPMVPPPPNRAPTTTLWCVAKASVPEPIIQEAMNYACGSGADCGGIQPNGPCFQPNTLFAHASYAFNSYWQRTKLTTGGTCDFGGTAVLVTVDPSYDGCHFVYF